MKQGTGMTIYKIAKSYYMEVEENVLATRLQRLTNSKDAQHEH